MIAYIESFVFILFAELLLTFYAIHSNNGNKNKASTFAALNTVLYCANIDNIIKDYWCIAFAAGGAFAGTWISVKWFEKKY